MAKLLDFGLVKERSRAPDVGAGADDASFSGTPLFMSPEQASAYEHVDRRADIYALGAVAYYLLTGQPVFTGRNVVQLLAAHAAEEVAPPSTVNDEVPRDLEQVVLRRLEKKASDRFPDATSLERALSACECSTDWTVEAAAAWWRDNAGPREPLAPSEHRDIEVTVDLIPQEKE